MKKIGKLISCAIASLMVLQGAIGVSAANLDLKVDTDVEVSYPNANNYVDGPIQTTQVGSRSQYKATLYMNSVRDAFTKSMADARAKFANLDAAQKAIMEEKLTSSVVTGEFVLEMNYPTDISKQDGLTGFSSNTGKIFYCSSRNNNGNYESIKIAVKDGITAGEIEKNLNTYLGDITFSRSTSNKIYSTGSAYGTMTGNISVASGAYTANFESQQLEGHGDTLQPGKIGATVVILTKSVSGSISSNNSAVNKATFVNRATGEAFTVTDFTYNQATGGYDFTTDLPAGDYFISEIETVDGTQEVDYTKTDAVITVPEDTTTPVEVVASTTAKTETASIAVATNPSKTVYKKGEAFDPTGLVLTVSNSDGTQTTVAYTDANKDKFSFAPSTIDGAGLVSVIYDNKLATVAVETAVGSAEIMLTAPVANKEAEYATVSDDAEYSVTDVTWSPELINDKFDYSTQYTATITVEPMDGVAFTSDMTATVSGKKADSVTVNSDGTATVTYKFSKTGSKNSSNGGNHVSGGTTNPSTTATPNPNATATPAPSTDPETGMPFTDVSTTDWYFDSVKYMYDSGLMNGTSTTTFEPETAVDRAMFITILNRLEGQPTATEATAFTDVANGDYFENAVAWGAENGIVNGISETEYAPYEPITREQMAAMILRYANFKGVGPVGAWMINLPYPDKDQIEEYAFEAVAYVTANGIMKGDENGMFQPKSDATRAEIATVVTRFSQNILNK